MQKNLLLKTGIIVGTLLVFLYGMLGIPKGLGKQALLDGLHDRIHLGLDLKGGTHLILQVRVNEAVDNETNQAMETLKDELQKAKVTYADISKPDSKNQPEKIVIKGVPLDAGPTLSGIVTDKFPDYDITGGQDNSWNMVMKPQAVSTLKDRTVDQSIEAI